MIRPLSILAAVSAFIVLPACISSEESGANRQDPISQESVSPAPQSSETRQASAQPKGAPTPGRQSKQPQSARLTSKRDTVVASVTKRTATAARSARPLERPNDPAYTVQVGAFSRAQNALTYQKLAKERFANNSVHNRYEARDKLYRVSVGKFTTRKEAAALRREIMKKYPKDYSQAWVSYIPK